MDTKICTGCHQPLPLASYHRKSSAPDGRVARCKKCRTEDEALGGAAHRGELGFEPLGPFLDWLETDGKVHLESLHMRNANLARAILRVRTENLGRVSAEVVDEMSLIADDPGLLSRLYPCILPEDDDCSYSETLSRSAGVR